MKIKKPSREKCCKGKQAHVCKGDAITALKNSFIGTKILHALNVYRCPYCYLWHIGKVPPQLVGKTLRVHVVKSNSNELENA